MCVKNYTQKYIDECRLKANLQLSSYKNIITTGLNQVGANNALLNSVIESFEPNFFKVSFEV